LRDLTLVGQTNNKNETNKKEKQIPQKAKTNPTKKQKQIPQTEMPSPLHSIVRSEIQRLFIKILYVLDDNRRS